MSDKRLHGIQSWITNKLSRRILKALVGRWTALRGLPHGALLCFLHCLSWHPQRTAVHALEGLVSRRNIISNKVSMSKYKNSSISMFLPALKCHTILSRGPRTRFYMYSARSGSAAEKGSNKERCYGVSNQRIHLLRYDNTTTTNNNKTANITEN